jgi:hypothetical protein
MRSSLRSVCIGRLASFLRVPVEFSVKDVANRCNSMQLVQPNRQAIRGCLCEPW